MAGVSGVSGFRGPTVERKPTIDKKHVVKEKDDGEKQLENKQDTKLKGDLDKLKAGQEKHASQLRDLRRDVSLTFTRTARVEKDTESNSAKIAKVSADVRDTRRDLGRRIDIQAGDVRDKFKAVNKRVDDLDGRETRRHKEVNERIDNLEVRVGDALKEINVKLDKRPGDVSTKELEDKIDSLDDKVTSGFSGVNKAIANLNDTNSAKFDELNEQLSKLNEQLENLTEKIGSLKIAIGEFGDVTDKFSGLVAKIISPEFGALSAANVNGSFRFAQRGLQVFGILQAAAGGSNRGLGSAGQNFASGVNSLRQGLAQKGFNNPNHATQLQAALTAALSQAPSGLQLDDAA